MRAVTQEVLQVVLRLVRVGGVLRICLVLNTLVVLLKTSERQNVVSDGANAARIA